MSNPEIRSLYDETDKFAAVVALVMDQYIVHNGVWPGGEVVHCKEYPQYYLKVADGEVHLHEKGRHHFLKVIWLNQYMAVFAWLFTVDLLYKIHQFMKGKD